MTQKRQTINPYLIALRIVNQRLKWDLHPHSWTARRRLISLKDKYRDSKAIILCNGPSLNTVDFEFLKQNDIFVFGLNKINFLFDKTEFRPNAIVVVNPYVIEQNASFYNKTDIPLFVDSAGIKHIRLRKNIYFIHSSSLLSKNFARNCSMSISQGYTVTFVAMQLAFHFGFKTVALTGCDHSYQYSGNPNDSVESGKVDVNHFDENYFANGNIWQNPDLLGSELHYRFAKSNFEKYGKKIVNCTQGGKLEIFERQNLKDFVLSE